MVATKMKSTVLYVPIAEVEITSLRKVHGEHIYLINRYELSVLLTTTNKFRLS
jgi:hypothetical protein